MLTSYFTKIKAHRIISSHTSPFLVSGFASTSYESKYPDYNFNQRSRPTNSYSSSDKRNLRSRAGKASERQSTDSSRNQKPDSADYEVIHELSETEVERADNTIPRARKNETPADHFQRTRSPGYNGKAKNMNSEKIKVFLFLEFFHSLA
jgi:hypothetical protein